jgi:hypothetical protein
VTDDEAELETAFKVVAIMQTIAEELDETSKKMWRKMLGLSDKPNQSPEDGIDKSES